MKHASLLVALLLSPAVAVAQPQEKAGWTLFRASPSGLKPREPRLIPTKQGPYLAWQDEEAKQMRIAPFDPKMQKVGAPWPTRFRKLGKDVVDVFGDADREQLLKSYDVQVSGLLEAWETPRAGERPSFLAITRRFYLPLDGPTELLNVRVMPRVKDSEYELVEFSPVIADRRGFGPVDQGGVGRYPPMHSCLLRRSNPGGTALFLAVSSLEHIWTTQSTDGGKTWSPHCHVRSDRYWCEVVEMPTELVMFCLSRTYSLEIMRSRDGKKWLEPEPIFPKLKVTAAPAAKLDKDGGIWLAFGVGSEDKRSILLTRSTDGGKSWTEPEQVTTGHHDVAVSLALHNDAPVLAILRVTNAGQKEKESRAIWGAVKKAGSEKS